MKLSRLVPSKPTRIEIGYFSLAITLTGLVYVAVQQDLRLTANDPQIQIAEDTAAALDKGQTPDSLAIGPEVDMKNSLAPFIIITDRKLNVQAATGKLNGKVVLPPAGSFVAATASNGKYGPALENRFTWEPAPGVREAAVIVSRKDGYVVTARSLREVEVRETRLSIMVSAAFIALALVGLILMVLL